SDQIGCELKNDPQLTTYDRETVNFPFPCRYLASHVKPSLIDRHGNVIGYCEAKVYGMNAKYDGKMFVMGFDVALKIVYTQNNKIVESSYRQYGSADNNENDVVAFGKNGAWAPFVPDGTDDISYKDAPKGIQIDTHWDHRVNRFSYTVTGCGLKVTFVPYDRSLKLNQRQVPGLSVSVLNTHAPEHLSPTDAVCMVPTAAGGHTLNDITLLGLSQERSVLLRAFKNQPTQNLPFPVDGSSNAQCSAIGDILNNCQLARQKEAISNCDWILKNPHFMKCYDRERGSPHLISLFKSCVEAWCVNRPCTDTIDSITNKGCNAIGKVPRLASFVAGVMCPSPIP
ncbi:hypothetical protein EGW08_008091, partial [Elysia chlorotica]